MLWVRGVDQLQRPDALLHRQGGRIRRREVPFGRALLSAHSDARRVDPCPVQLASGAAVIGPLLLRHALLQLLNQLAHIAQPHALVAVGERGEADGNVWVGELVDAGGAVFADKGNGQHASRLGHEGVCRQVGANLRVGEQSEGDSVSLGQHVWQEGAQPVVEEVERLERVVREARLDGLLQRGGRGPGANVEVLDDGVVGHLPRAALSQPQQRPAGQRRPQLLLVKGGVQQHRVGCPLDHARLQPRRHRGTQGGDGARSLPRVADVARQLSVPRRSRHGSQQPEGQAPAQARLGA